MPFPKTLDELTFAGYTYSNHSTCRGCGEEIEWWKTPGGKSIPMNPMSRGISPATPHWSTCAEADGFRNRK